MSSVADRLHCLRRDMGAAQAGTSLARADPRDALREVMQRRERRVTPPLMPPAGEEVAPGVRCVEQRFAYAADPWFTFERFSPQPIERTRLLCFDTETTGLAGGVGTRAFMIGVASWHDDVLTVRQLYLTTVAGEAAMLRLFVGWLREDTVLASYNGKCYDAPLLKGRLRLNSVAHPLDALPHIDWLHPTRRAYRGVYENCRLATIEREVLCIVRDDDLPGAQAPAAWIAWLRGQSSRNLARVLEHNRQDVVTLMRLGDHLSERER